jgi:hypothetical protein
MAERTHLTDVHSFSHFKDLYTIGVIELILLDVLVTNNVLPKFLPLC